MRAGETVLIYDRDEPVAKLTKFEFADDRDARYREAVRKGIIRPAEEPFDPSIFDDPLEYDGASVLEALLEERREGR